MPYLYLRQLGLKSLTTQRVWVEAERARVERLTGNEVISWRNVYSAEAGTVTFTSWWTKLSALEQAVDALWNDPTYVEIPERGHTDFRDTTDEDLLQVIYGDIPSVAPRYVRTLSAQCSPGHLESAVAIGVEIAKKAEELIGSSVQFAQSFTGSLGLVHWLSGYDNLADLQEAVEKFTGAASGWLYYRDHYDEVFVGPSMKISLRERFPLLGPRAGGGRELPDAS